MNIILSTIVGSRLHGTETADSDTDYRGVFMVDAIDLISPFRKQKDTSWLEGEEDNTAYELTKFCKMCSQGNPACLEVLVGLDHEVTLIGERLQCMLPKFLSMRCVPAFMGYSKNQEKKFRDDNTRRKYKYASAHVRTLFQLKHLLMTGELIGQYDEFTTDVLRSIKNGEVDDAEIMKTIFELETACKNLEAKSPLQVDPDIAAIEDFIYDAYLK